MKHRHALIYSFATATCVNFEIAGGFLLEVCLAKWWANLGSVNISFSVTFHGISPDSKSIVLHAAEGITRLEATSPLHSEEVSRCLQDNTGWADFIFDVPLSAKSC